MTGKTKEVAAFIRRKAEAAIAEITFGNPPMEVLLRKYRGFLAGEIVKEIINTYGLLELSDIIMGRKRRGGVR